MKYSSEMADVEVKSETDLTNAGETENSQIDQTNYELKLEDRGLDQGNKKYICIKEEQDEQEVCIKKDYQLQECPFNNMSLKSEENKDSSATICQKSSLECKVEINGEDSTGSKLGYSFTSQRLRLLHSNHVKETDSDTDDSEDWNRKPSANSSTGPEVDHSLYSYRHSDTDSDNWSWEWEPPVHAAKKTEKEIDEKDQILITGNNKNINKRKGKTKQHHCPVCKKSFVDNTGLKRHELIHSGQRPFSCLVCKKDFTRKCHLKSHLRTHTDEKPFTCSVCRKSFREKSYMMTHMRNHTGEKPFSCSECGKAFKRKQELRDHRVVHSHVKPFNCTVCKKGFKQKRVLRSHMLIHSGDKPWKCSICEKVFTQKNNLNIHMMVHSGEKPFSCSFCNKAFSRKRNLFTHMLIHTGEKPLTCPVCKKCYRHQSSMQKHMKSHKRQLKRKNNVTGDQE